MDVETDPAPVATFGDVAITVDALLLELVANGEWPAVRERVRAGVASERSAADPPSRAAVRAAEVAFRQARRLLAADDLKAWLADRSLSVEDWRGHLGREIRCAEPGSGSVEVRDDELPALCRVALVVDGRLDAALDRLLEGAAAADFEDEVGTAAELAAVEGSESAGDLAELAVADAALPLDVRDVPALTSAAATVLAFRAARQRAFAGADPRHVRELLAERRVDWTRIEFDELVLPTAAAAREAVLCVGSDGMDLTAVGALAGTAHRSRACTAEESGSAAAPLLLAATPGAPLGPIEDGGGWRVLVLRARHLPEADDPVVWNRARDEVVAERLRRRLAGKVRFHAAV